MATIEETLDKAIEVAVKRAEVLDSKVLNDAKEYTNSFKYLPTSELANKITDWLVDTVTCVHTATYPSNGSRTSSFTAAVGKRYLIRQWLSDYAGSTQNSQSSTLTISSGATVLKTLANYHTHRVHIIKATSTTVSYYSQNAQANWHSPANVEVYQLD